MKAGKLDTIRWSLVAVLVAGALLNYLDRSALAVVSARIRDDLHLSASQYADVVNAFLIAYTLSYLFGGMIADKIGTRWSIAGTVIWWSLSNMAHGLARNLWQLSACRFSLGLGEAMFYPAALRCVAEWIPAKDRSKAVGLILGGSTLGSIAAPLIVAPMMAHPEIGWRGAFVFTGALGFLLLPFWLGLYRRPDEHPDVSEVEREALRRDQAVGAKENVPIRVIAQQPQARLLMVARALTDSTWYLLVFWMIQYLQKGRGFTDIQVAQWGWIPFAAADLGAIFGGWCSSALIARGMPLLKARKATMACSAMLMAFTLPAFFAPQGSPAIVILLFSLATFGHMSWGTNSWTLHGDLFPAGRVATVLGITGAAGSLGGVAAQKAVGMLVDAMNGSYLPVFLLTASMHPLAALLVTVGLKDTEQTRKLAA